jgi:hypothetical protein
MHFNTAVCAVVSALAGLSAAAPAAQAAPRSFGVPTDDGFPTPNAQQLLSIENKADGTLSNAPPPPKLANSSLTAFQLIAFNEIFEVAFFSSLLSNITNGVSGFNFQSEAKRTEFVDILQTVLAVCPIPHLARVRELR